MSLPRYHIHLACVTEDAMLQTAQDDVAIFAEGRASVTRNLLVNRSRSSNYAWRCISDCDVVVILIGESYGSVDASGVSQLHLSYSTARTTKKPMVVLINRSAQPTADRHVLDLIKLIEAQDGASVTYFDESRNLLSILEATVGKALLEKDRTKQMLVTEMPNLPNLSSTINTPKSTNISQMRAKKHISSHSLRPALLLDNQFDVGCTAHAFQGGQLITPEFDIRLTWRTVLTALVKLGVPFSSQGLSRCLNELIDRQQAHDMVLKVHPEVHAVSRLQVVKSDALWIQDELQLAGHIEPADPNGTSTLWQVSQNAQYALNSPRH